MLLTDISQLKSSPANEPVTVIIGSGAIGLYAASELVKRGRRVIVVESGDRTLGGFSSRSFDSVGVPHDGIKTARSRSLGGTTNLWGGQLVEFQPIDFAGRDWLPGSRWPVQYDEIAPYFKSSYENLGLPSQTNDDDEVWKSVSSQRPELGEEFEAFLTRWLKVPNFASRFAPEFENNEKFSVLMGHTVIGFDGSDGRVSAVRVVDASGNRHTIPGDTFILAAGTIENSRLLLQAQADDTWHCPWKSNPNIGVCFLDHIGGRVASVQPNDKKRFFNTFCTIARRGQKYQPKFRLRNDILARDKVLTIHGYYAFESSVSENLVYLKQFVKAALYSRKISGLRDLAKNTLACSKYLIPLMWRYVWDNRIFVPGGSKISLLVQAEQGPTPQSRLRLDPSVVDSFGLPRVVLDWKMSGHEQASMLDFAKRAAAALQTHGLATLNIEPDLLAMDPKFMESVGDTKHQSGGTLMGLSEQDGVVDSDLKVFGAANFYIAGSSIFRTIGNANTTFTAIAFTSRLIDHLQKI